MSVEGCKAFFLWVGGSLPDIARISVLSAAEAGFEAVLFTDRSQPISHRNLQVADWREIDLPWSPEQVRLKGEERPCYAAFSDLFRFALLSRHEGWWFDCDTLIMRTASDFSSLLRAGSVTVGRESTQIINGAVIGSVERPQMLKLYDAAFSAFPVLSEWGVVGPALITRMVADRKITANIVDRDHFYPVHHNDIGQIYLPEFRDALLEQEPKWFCLSLWGEVLSRSGLKHLAPPPDSYLANYLARHPSLGAIRGNDAALAHYLAGNLRRLDDMSSGRLALQTLARKVVARFMPTKRG